MRPRSRIGVLTAAVAVAGCGDPASPEGSGLAIRVDTVAGIEQVHNRGTPPSWHLEPAGDIGVAGGAGDPDPREFGRVHGLALDSTGTVWVGDAQSHEVRRFGADGTFLGSFGRSGQGPGEMRSLQSLGWLGPDTLALLDSAQGRILLFAPDGAHLGQFPYPGGVTGPPTVVRLYPLTGGLIYAFAPGGGRGQEFHGYTPAGRADVLPRRPPEGLAPASAVCPRPDGAISFFLNPYAPGALVRPVAPGLNLVARTDTLRLTWVDAEGDTVRVATDSVPRVPVTDEDWDEAMADYRAFRRENPGVSCDPEPVRPRLKPPITDGHVDADGRLWLETRGPDGPLFRVFDRDGRLIAQAEAPPRSSRIPPAFAAGWMVLLDEGPLGEDVIRRFRILHGEAEAHSR